MNKDFSYYLSKYLNDYMIIERNLSKHTLRQYKKTFSILVEYLVNIKNFKLNDITFKNITREMITDFLNYLEEDLGNTDKTRNQRLAGIKSFYQYCLTYEVNNIENIRQVLSIKVKKSVDKIMEYLTEEELDKVFKSVDTKTLKGRRDLLILVMLYDTAARADELRNLKLEDIRLEEKCIILTGKGNKQRLVSIMERTKEMLIKYLKENNITYGYLFQNKFGDNYSKNFISVIVEKYSIIKNKTITPHMFRRTRAIHLLANGVNIMYIKELLGHASVQTTEKYAKVLEKNKFEAIEKANPKMETELPDWNDNQDLLSQLLNI